MRIFTLLTVLLLSFTCSVAKANTAVDQYVTKLINQVSTMLADTNLTPEAKVKKSKELLQQNLDFDYMAKAVFDKKKYPISDQEFKQFRNTYSQYVIKSYSDLVKNYNGEKTTVSKVIDKEKKEYEAHTKVLRQSGDPINVKYQVHEVGSGFKVADIITEGVSLRDTQKAEFSNIMSSNGGDFKKLLQALEKKL